MPLFVLADPSGRITQTGNMGDDSFENFNPPERTKLAVAYLPADAATFIATHYVADGQIMARQDMPIIIDPTTILADGRDIVTLTSLPQPCTVTVTGVIQAGPMTIEGGELEITSDHPGEFKITVSAGVEWRDWEATIHAT